ncbi:MAG TPA: DNA repair exonuclease [Candidatus Krumholzibacteria bacterium]|nr:DNA repair exonuclease [Candidatus Krumholzibacteria bacterium]HPD70614.1 DNA repair exonuclease [Candidatus Krumholzibacteria bacterium]HRY39686.1 DNA repair exonuclease [Candidatus Krumholzibacteria bacterium]
MPDQDTRLLAVGDIHLGRRRRAGQVPADLDRDDLGPRGAWRRTVDVALQIPVDGVLLAGDVVDSLNDRFEAFGALASGVRRLLDAGVRVLAVAGNHDGHALPRLADLLPGFELLGRGGRWESRVIDGPGGAVRVAGWSFPADSHGASALAAWQPLERDLPTIGLLHCDLDASGGRHAPTPRADLARAGCDRWLLGHVHRPSAADEPIGYLGSLVGLDPTETGAHGPWLVTVADRRISRRLLPLAPLRWEALEVDCTGLEEPAAGLVERVLARIDRFRRDCADELGEVEALGLRLRLVGRCARVQQLHRAAAALAAAVTFDDLAVFLDRVDVAVAPAHDLDELARSDTPFGLLARRLCDLRDSRSPALLGRAAAALAAVDQRFLGLEPGPAVAAATVEDLLQAGYRALDLLLDQQERGHAPR